MLDSVDSEILESDLRCDSEKVPGRASFRRSRKRVQGFVYTADSTPRRPWV